jgi:alginate O-acetyltransferase complex protein AlgI
VWGLYHGAFLIAERLIWGKAAGEAGSALRLRFLYCIPSVMVGWIIFRAGTMNQAGAFIGALLNPFAEHAFTLPPGLMGPRRCPLWRSWWPAA